MSRSSATRRTAATCGAAGLIALSLAGPAAAREDPGTGQLPRCTSGCYEGGGTSTAPAPTADDSTYEAVRVAAGVLAGIALVGAGAAIASRRSHAHAAHPA
jgi:hypothetical protein